jgi:hypothetical protein
VSVSLTDKAEAGQAAGAQAPFPSRRAREKSAEKVTMISVCVVVVLRSDLLAS